MAIALVSVLWWKGSRDVMLDRIHQQESDLRTARERLGDHDSRLGAHDRTLGEHESALSREGQINEAQTTRIEELDALIRSEAARLREAIEEGTRRLRELEASAKRIPELEEELEGLRDEQSSLTRELESIEGRLQDLELAREEERARLERIESMLGITPQP